MASSVGENSLSLQSGGATVAVGQLAQINGQLYVMMPATNAAELLQATQTVQTSLQSAAPHSAHPATSSPHRPIVFGARQTCNSSVPSAAAAAPTVSLQTLQTLHSAGPQVAPPTAQTAVTVPPLIPSGVTKLVAYKPRPSTPGAPLPLSALTATGPFDSFRPSAVSSLSASAASSTRQTNQTNLANLTIISSTPNSSAKRAPHSTATHSAHNTYSERSSLSDAPPNSIPHLFASANNGNGSSSSNGVRGASSLYDLGLNLAGLGVSARGPSSPGTSSTGSLTSLGAAAAAQGGGQFALGLEGGDGDVFGDERFLTDQPPRDEKRRSTHNEGILLSLLKVFSLFVNFLFFGNAAQLINAIVKYINKINFNFYQLQFRKV